MIDDDELMLRALSICFKTIGWHAALASSHAQARSLLEPGTHEFDAVLIDLVLSDGDGLRILELMRLSGDPCAAVMMSGFASPLEVQRAIAFGAVDFLLKPFEHADVETAVGRAVATTRAWRARMEAVAREKKIVPPSEEAALDLDAMIEKLTSEVWLSSRQIEVLRLVIAGKSNKEVSAALGIGLSTTKYHLVTAMQRLSVRSRGELMWKVLKS